MPQWDVSIDWICSTKTMTNRQYSHYWAGDNPHKTEFKYDFYKAIMIWFYQSKIYLFNDDLNKKGSL
jgi:hypothetical protein